MEKLLLFLTWITILVISCRKNEVPNPGYQSGEECLIKLDIQAPDGLEIKQAGKINFNGNVQQFQFVDKQIGYALLSKNVGGYAEVFKTTDGGISWSNLDIDFPQFPRGIAFKNADVGIVTVHDVTGCPPPNCQNKCVVLKTTDGGEHWEQIEYESLKGILYHPKFDSDGNLYANLSTDGNRIIMKSTDEGTSWDTLINLSSLGYSMAAINFEIFEDKLYISESGGKIIVTLNDGTILKTIETYSKSVRDMYVVDENNLWVVTLDSVLSSKNGGQQWEAVFESAGQIIGFESADKALMLFTKSYCGGDVYQSNDLFAFTNDGGATWIEADDTTTNMGITNSQKMGSGLWYFIIDNRLMQAKII